MNQQSSRLLIEFLAKNPVPWLRYDESCGKFIMVVDNHLLSTYRNCPQHFMNQHVFGLARKSRAFTAERHPWFLQFGIALHEALEVYYKNFRSPGFDTVDFCTRQAIEIWNKYELDVYSEEKEYKTIGGCHGFIGLLVQYATVMSPQNEKLRVITTEVSFGKRKEVCLAADEYLEVYLAGRMDILVDDGYFICPMDHKSKASFKGEVGIEHMIDEGPTGYIYALKAILPSLIPEDQFLKRDCSKILMNYISKIPTTDPAARFKRIVIRKTEWELEEYRFRMARTAHKLLEDMEQIACNLPVDRNTGLCQNWFRMQCRYFDLCRQQSPDGLEATLKNGFVKLPLWDTEAISQNE